MKEHEKYILDILNDLINRVTIIENTVRLDYKDHVKILTKRLDEMDERISAKIYYNNINQDAIRALDDKINSIAKNAVEMNKKIIKENALISRRLTKIEKSDNIQIQELVSCDKTLNLKID